MSEKKPSLEQSSSKKGLNTTQIILIIGVILILVVISVFGAITYRSMTTKEPATSNYVVDESNFEEITQKMVSEVAEGMFEVLMNVVWNFPDPSKPSIDAYVANAKGNNKPFFIEVTLNDTDELIYTSAVLPVGNTFKEIILDKKDISPGIYTAACKYNFLDENGETASSVSFTVTINIG